MRLFAAILLALLAAPLHAEISVTAVDSLALPPGEVTGLCWAGGDTLALLVAVTDSLAIAESQQMFLVVGDTAGTIYWQEEFTGLLARGLAWDGEFLWSCGDADDGSSILYQIQADTVRVEEAYNTPGHRPSAICWDGRFLWISDRDSGRIDRFDPEAKEITRSVVTPGFSPFGLAWDGLHMWLTDSGTGRLYRLAGSRRSWNATADAESFMYRGIDVLLLHDGESFWMVPDGVNHAIRIRFD